MTTRQALLFSLLSWRLNSCYDVGMTHAHWLAATRLKVTCNFYVQFEHLLHDLEYT